jgi:hypothetical protein
MFCGSCAAQWLVRCNARPAAPGPAIPTLTPALHHSGSSPLRLFTTPALHHSGSSPLRLFTTLTLRIVPGLAVPAVVTVAAALTLALSVDVVDMTETSQSEAKHLQPGETWLRESCPRHSEPPSSATFATCELCAAYFWTVEHCPSHLRRPSRGTRSSCILCKKNLCGGCGCRWSREGRRQCAICSSRKKSRKVAGPSSLQCARCHKSKPLDEFKFLQRQQDGSLQSKCCKGCRKNTSKRKVRHQETTQHLEPQTQQRSPPRQAFSPVLSDSEVTNFRPSDANAVDTVDASTSAVTTEANAYDEHPLFKDYTNPAATIHRVLQTQEAEKLNDDDSTLPDDCLDGVRTSAVATAAGANGAESLFEPEDNNGYMSTEELQMISSANTTFSPINPGRPMVNDGEVHNYH